MSDSTTGPDFIIITAGGITPMTAEQLQAWESANCISVAGRPAVYPLSGQKTLDALATLTLTGQDFLVIKNPVQSVVIDHPETVTNT